MISALVKLELSLVRQTRSSNVYDADSAASSEAICQAVEYTYIAGRARIQHTARAELAKHYAVKKLEFT